MPLLPPPFSILLNLVKFFLWLYNAITRRIKKNEDYTHDERNGINMAQIIRFKFANRIKAEFKEIDKTAIANMMERKMTKKVLDNIKINQ